MIEDLISKAKKAHQRSYAPYSKFHVGAAILADDGRLYAGCNVENAAYPQGLCAEAGAISAMICGGGKSIETILIYSEAERPIYPCGGCRQKISEFAHHKTQVFIASKNGVRHQIPFAEIMPFSFTDEDLG